MKRDPAPSNAVASVVDDVTSSAPSMNDGKQAGPMKDSFDCDALTAEQRLDMCEQIVGHVFNDRNLLLEALTHASGLRTV
ncbi:MAG: hypothetical protein R3C05_16440 [Pirellulaceae bacterium]